MESLKHLAIRCASKSCCCFNAYLESKAYIGDCADRFFNFIEFYFEGGGTWTKFHKKFVADWYLSVDLAYFVRSFQKKSRAWTHCDLLRLSHPRSYDPSRDAVFAYVARGYECFSAKRSACCPKIVEYIDAYEKMKACDDPFEAVPLIVLYRFREEHVPDRFLCDADVWYAILLNSPVDEISNHIEYIKSTRLLKKHPDAIRFLRLSLYDRHLKNSV